MSRAWIAAALAAATLASEDATAVGAGVLAATGQVDLWLALPAVAAGIYLGDLGLFAIGRLARRLAWARRWMEHRWDEARLADAAARFERHAGRVILGSRFVPGSRLLIYVAAGYLARRSLPFYLWTLVAVALWTPLLVVGTAWLGARFAAGAEWTLAWAPVAGLPAAWLVLARWLRGDPADARALAPARSRWEFWPMWALYPPVVAWIAWLALRHRGIAAIPAANPAFPEGGLVGESKFDILRQLPAAWTIPGLLLPPGAAASRADDLERGADACGWAYPLILKPDVGQRGAGVRRVASRAEAEAYLAEYPDPVLAQPWHAGPFEAGILYWRRPGEAHGRIFSITDKVFPAVVGDGRSTLEALVLAHPRYASQADTFLRRHDAIRSLVLAAGARFALGHIGNHAQGALFRDGGHLWTPALEARIDAIARAVPGFYIGRFDVRYASVDAFRAGADLAIVELNGVTSESTNIYDPSRGLLDAYRTLFAQWRLIFEIGAANLRRGTAPTPVRRLARIVLDHLRDRREFPIAG